MKDVSRVTRLILLSATAVSVEVVVRLLIAWNEKL